LNADLIFLFKRSNRNEFLPVFAGCVFMSILLLLESNFLPSGQVQHEVTVTLKLVQVYVTDKNGEPISDLKPSDFELFDNGEPVKITEFERHILSFPALQPEMEAPRKYEDRELASPPARLSRKFFLLFDFAFNDGAGILKAKQAALHFVDQLSPADEVGLMSYKSGKGFTLHEYLTKDHEKIRKVVESFGLKDYSGRAQKIWEDPIEKSPKAPADEDLS
jgi:VWFA-related protein